MKLQWSEIPHWPSRELVHFFTPMDFKKIFKNTRETLDSTEISMLKPALPFAQQVTFSTYKNDNTVKSVVITSKLFFFLMIAEVISFH